MKHAVRFVSRTLRASLSILYISAVLALTLFAPRSSQAQGPLTPPGTPAPTMKTLQQVEPRTPITNATAVTISTSGSYYLTSNITVTNGDAIDINASGVTLDLNGFTIGSTDPNTTGYGIFLNNGLGNITIVNGFIRGGVTNNASGVYSGSGFESGIYGPFAENVRVSGVSVSGCIDTGIYLWNGDSTVVESCTVRTVGGYGIIADTTADSSALYCGSDAITAGQASRCHGMSFGGAGIRAKAAQNCYGTTSGGGVGISVSIAENCYGQSSSSAGYGMSAAAAENCYGTSTGSGIGLSAASANNCYGTCTGSGIGLSATRTAKDCYGSSSSGTGLSAIIADSCYGASTSGDGVSATTANNCYGTSGGGSVGDAGVSATIALNCYGVVIASYGNGLHATTATGCYGQASNSPGLNCDGTALNCYGVSTHDQGLYAGNTAMNCFGSGGSGSTGLGTYVAVGCYGASTGYGLACHIANSCFSNGGGDTGIDYPYNMP